MGAIIQRLDRFWPRVVKLSPVANAIARKRGRNCLANGYAGGSRLRGFWLRGLFEHGQDVCFAKEEELFASDLDLVSGVGEENDAVPFGNLGSGTKAVF